jgi:hypothetical protein
VPIKPPDVPPMMDSDRKPEPAFGKKQESWRRRSSRCASRLGSAASSSSKGGPPQEGEKGGDPGGR